MITIIVPVYNVEKYLRRCIESLLLQSYTNYEILLIDDGSTDSSVSICDEYANKYANIRVIHKNNAGLGKARNTGIDNAYGEYITFVDSDDFADVDLLKDLIQGLEDNFADACVGGFKKVNDNEKILFIEEYPFEIYSHNGFVNEVFIKMLGSLPNQHDSIRMSVWNAIYKISIIRQFDIKFPSERQFLSEDIIFDLEYYKHASNAVVLNNSNYNYRYNLDSLTTSYKKDRFDLTIFLFKYLENELQRNNFNEESFLRLYKLFFIYVRSAISQEKTNLSKYNKKTNIRNINKICNNDYLRNKINNYPIKDLGFKQKIFLLLIKYKCCRLLYILT